MARLEQAQLAQSAGVSLETIKRLERIRGPIRANARTLAALAEALERNGIEIEQHADGAVGLRSRGATGRQSRVGPLAPPEAPDLHRLIYHSACAFADSEAEAALDSILAASIANNTDRGISGALAFANGRFLQALEGESGQVAQVYEAIARDPRHRGLSIVENRAVAVRRFPNWVMCARAAGEAEMGRADSSQQAGFRPELLSPAAALGVLTWVSELELGALR